MMQTTEQVLAELTQIMRKVFGNDTIVLQPETTARDVKEWDSLNHIQFVIAVEKHFKIRFNFAELQKFKNVGEMADNVAAKLSSAAPRT
jgi:acyl carrier protein